MHCIEDVLRCIYLFFLKRYAQGIFDIGRSNVPTQQKKTVATNVMHFQSTHPASPNLQHL